MIVSPCSVEIVFERSAVDAGDEHRPSARHVRERRHIDAQLVTAEVHGAVARRVAADRVPRERSRQDTAAERKGAGDDPLLTVDDLDQSLRPTGGRIERARRGEQRRSRGGQLRNTDCARAQRAVELVLEVTP